MQLPVQESIVVLRVIFNLTIPSSKEMFENNTAYRNWKASLPFQEKTSKIKTRQTASPSLTILSGLNMEDSK